MCNNIRILSFPGDILSNRFFWNFQIADLELWDILRKEKITSVKQYTNNKEVKFGL